MASNYEGISKYNEEQLGKDRRSRMTQVAMYADSAHFVYELLQNADDAGATEIRFELAGDGLVVEHDGTPFSSDDVAAITYFGKGKADVTAIGHFGLGFKSVFAYTASPRIHSGSESFRISDLYSVSSCNYPDDLPQGRTRFVLPFDHQKMRPDYVERVKWRSWEAAYREIDKKLGMLGGETLLFTRSLREIVWTTSDRKGHYLREDRPVTGGGTEVVLVTNGDDASYFLSFSRTIEWTDEDGLTRPRRPVAIAFQLSGVLADKAKISGSAHQKLWVFFPTEKETYLGFIVQGPYRTTPARDNVPEDDEFNKYLVIETASLLLETLVRLRSLRILDFDAIERLPIDIERFGEASFLHPLHREVLRFLREERSWPAYPRGYVAATQAKLARGRDLAELIEEGQLVQLFKTDGLRWIHPDLTEDQYPTLHRCLVGRKRNAWSEEWIVPPLVEGIEIRPEDAAKRFAKTFMEEQSEAWVIKLYTYLGAARGNLYQQFRECPLMRLEGGRHAFAFDKSGKALVFLPTGEESAFPTVKQSLLENGKAKQFLVEVVGLRPPDIVDEVLNRTLPKYASEGKSIAVDQWKKDFKRFIEALSTDSAGKRLALIKSAKELAFVLVVENVTGATKFKRGDNAYFDSEDNRVFFDGKENVHFVTGSEYPDGAEKVLEELGVARLPRLTCRPPAYSGYVSIASYWGSHSRGLNGFDPDWAIDGLEHALANPSMLRSRLIWTSYVLPHCHLIRGVVESSSRQTFEGLSRKEGFSKTGQLLIEASWLPRRNETFDKPSALLPADLPEDFETNSGRARAAAEALGMKRAEAQRAVEELVGGDSRLKGMLEQFVQVLNTGDEATLNKFKKLLPGIAAPPVFKSFRDGVQQLHRHQRETNDSRQASGRVNDPGRYQSKLVEGKKKEIDDFLAASGTPCFTVVRTSESTSKAREFLYQQYLGRCQVTGHTFPKENGANYFEAVSLVPYPEASYLSDPGNMLCLSADTAARFLYSSFEWLDDLSSKIEEFRPAVSGGTEEHCLVRVRLTGEECRILFTEQHFMRLKALWDVT